MKKKEKNQRSPEGDVYDVKSQQIQRTQQTQRKKEMTRSLSQLNQRNQCLAEDAYVEENKQSQQRPMTTQMPVPTYLFHIDHHPRFRKKLDSIEEMEDLDFPVEDKDGDEDGV